MAKIVQIVAKHDGKLVALRSDGRLFEQYAPDNALPRTPLAWRQIPAPDAPRVVHLAARPTGILVAVTADGSLWQQVRDEVRDYLDFRFRWEPIATGGLE